MFDIHEIVKELFDMDDMAKAQEIHEQEDAPQE